MTWLSVDVPGSGKTTDLAHALMSEWDRVLSRHLPKYHPRFDETLNKKSRKGGQMLGEWRQVAAGSFLGLLHLDEVQNFFKIDSLEKRRSTKKGSSDYPLSLVEDECLKWVLTLTNTWQIPLLLTGTPDGIGALTSRLATLQRITTAGLHLFERFKSSDDPAFVAFMRELGKYQYTRKTLNIDNIHRAVYELTAGVRRLIIALWIGAHRIALSRIKDADDELRVGDFVTAAKTFLSPLAPAVHALLSGDHDALRRYEDLKPNQMFWNTFWQTISERSE